MSANLPGAFSGPEVLRPILNAYDFNPPADSAPRLRELNLNQFCLESIYEVVHDPIGKQFKLVQRDHPSREVLFSTVGIVNKHDFPGSSAQVAPSNKTTGIALSGLDSWGFLEAMLAAKHLYNFFYSHFHPDDFVLLNKQFCPDAEDPDQKFLHARGYFLSRCVSNELEHVPFSFLDDPSGNLTHSTRFYRELRPEELRHNAQHLTITGLGSADFAASLGALYKHHWQMTRETGRDVKEPRVGGQDEYKELQFKCRLFTTGKDASNTENVDLAPQVNRDGWIRYHAQRPDVRHGEDNRVFYEREVGNEETVPIPPSSVMNGDIVEVEFTMLGVPTLQGVVFLLLHSRVVVLDNNLGMEASMREYEHKRTAGSVGPQVKAKRRCEDQAVATANKRLARMAVTEGKEVEMKAGSEV